MDAACFLIIANLCLPPTDARAMVDSTTIGRRATVQYGQATVEIFESTDNIVQYDWPAAATVGGGAIRYWRYEDPATGQTDFTFNFGRAGRNIQLKVGREGRALLSRIQALGGEARVPLSELTVVSDRATPNRKALPGR
jgi:hypothetical protein